MNTELIQYRRLRAKETYADARVLLSQGSLFSTVNRVYYSLFYEVVALLLTRNLSSSKHSGTMGLFNEHFVKSGLVPTEFGKFYNRMFDFRQKSDYGEFINFEREKIEEWITVAERFIIEIEALINKALEKD